MIHLGTSGFSYDDWRGRFYPPQMDRAGMFDYYAERFGAVEINSTFYHIYKPAMMRSLVRRAEGRVTFAVKMSELVTHVGDLSPRVVADFIHGIEPAAEAGVLGAVLLQFPFRFKFNAENRQFINKAIRLFAAFPMVVEIRHRSWQSAAAWNYFEDGAISLCVVDMPRLAGLPATSTRLTGPTAYVRFHGRNTAQWFNAAYPGASYDYSYSAEQLNDWIEPIKKMERKAETSFAFFNNHLHAQAPENAYQLADMMGRPMGRGYYEDMFSGQLNRVS